MEGCVAQERQSVRICPEDPKDSWLVAEVTNEPLYKAQTANIPPGGTSISPRPREDHPVLPSCSFPLAVRQPGD